MPKVPMYDVNKLRQLALERGLTVAALARKAGMPQATVQQIFSRGSGHPLSLRRIAEALDLQLTLPDQFHNGLAEVPSRF